MKNLLLILAILMLGCGTDTEVVKEPIAEEPVAEEPSPVAEDPPSTVEDNHGDRILPTVTRSNVNLDLVPLDPVLLNRDGIFFEFGHDLALFKADILLDGQSLGWFPRVALTGDDIGLFAKLTPPADGPFLEYDKEYVIKLLAVDNGKDQRDMEIWFRTIPKP